jgi:hypothetical protein
MGRSLSVPEANAVAVGFGCIVQLRKWKVGLGGRARIRHL